MPRIARTAWSVEIVHYQHSIRSLSGYPRYHMRPVHLRATLSDLDSAPSVQRCKQHEQAALFVGCADKPGELRDAALGLLDLDHAHQKWPHVPSYLVDLQYVFHRAHKLRALTGRDAPTLLQPRLSSFFFKRLSEPSVLMVPDYLTLDQLVSQQLQGPTHAPAGGSPQAIAINRASPSPSSLTPTQLLFATSADSTPSSTTALAYSTVDWSALVTASISSFPQSPERDSSLISRMRAWVWLVRRSPTA